MQQTQLSKLMRLSWEVQKRRKSSRSKSLLAAWAIFLNEDITVYWLVQKHSTITRRDRVPTGNLTLFN
jgi:hypothetical protein